MCGATYLKLLVMKNVANLDTVNVTMDSVVEMVTYGLGVMPAYGEKKY